MWIQQWIFARDYYKCKWMNRIHCKVKCGPCEINADSEPQHHVDLHAAMDTLQKWINVRGCEQ